MNIEAIITHFVCVLIGGMLGVTAMAISAASGRASEEEREYYKDLGGGEG